MKKLIVVLCVAAMVLPATAAMAGPDDAWVVSLISSFTDRSFNSTACNYGTRTNSVDGSDVTDNAQDKTDTAAMMSCFDLGLSIKKVGYKYDYRAPMPSSQVEKIWNVRIWRGATYTKNAILLRAWNPTAYDINGSIPVKLVVHEDPTGSYAPGTVLWTWDPTKNGTSTNPAYSNTFTNCGVLQNNNPDSCIKLKLIAGTSYVPEPGSLVAMLSGLVGIVGYGIRRRK